MTFWLCLVVVGIGVGATTVLFGFGGGFVTVPVIAVVDSRFGTDALRVATATSVLVMLVNAAVATGSTQRSTLRALRGRWTLVVLLGCGGALGAEAGRFAPGSLVRWGFVLYLAATVVDLIARPGFLRPVPRTGRTGGSRTHGIATWLGAPVGFIAALLGVGGSVMTVPMMRRSGASMPLATTLANPLTLAITWPAALITLGAAHASVARSGVVGSVDVAAAGALLAGAMPVIVALRRRPPRIPEAVHAWGYLALLVAAGGTVVLAG